MKKLLLSLGAIGLTASTSSTIVSCATEKTGGFDKTIILNGWILNFKENYVTDIKINFDSFKMNNVTFFLDNNNVLNYQMTNYPIMSFKVNNELIEYQFSMSGHQELNSNLNLEERMENILFYLNSTNKNWINDSTQHLKDLLESKIADTQLGFNTIDGGIIFNTKTEQKFSPRN